MLVKEERCCHQRILKPSGDCTRTNLSHRFPKKVLMEAFISKNRQWTDLLVFNFFSGIFKLFLDITELFFLIGYNFVISCLSYSSVTCLSLYVNWNKCDIFGLNEVFVYFCLNVMIKKLKCWTELFTLIWYIMGSFHQVLSLLMWNIFRHSVSSFNPLNANAVVFILIAH